MDVVTIAKDLVHCNFDIQMWVNRRFKDPARCVVRKSVVDKIITPEGLIFCPEDTDILYRILCEYRFDDLKPDDVVLDLGANVGGFTLRAAKICKHVYAVEPLFVKELEVNIARNNLQDKITIIPYGVGFGEKININYQGTEKMVQTYPLSRILKMIPEKITFMKCDIEGAEWCIEPDDLSGISRIEFEVHTGKDSCLPEKPELLYYIRKNWNTETTGKRPENPGCYIHAYPKVQ